ncbi:MAG: SUKH-4 family immunity protein [Solirubrobacterales bacterium]
MITPKDFLDKWNKEVFPLVNYDTDKIKSLRLDNDAKEFLIEAGLPESAAPFLNFESSDKGGSTKLKDKFNLDSFKEKYIYLGFTGNGDLICVIEESGEVVCIDHENENDETFINSSVPKLAECLLEYFEFGKKIKSVNGRRAFLEGNATEELLEWITKKLEEIDSAALNERSFWREELKRYNKN